MTGVCHRVWSAVLARIVYTDTPIDAYSFQPITQPISTTWLHTINVHLELDR